MQTKEICYLADHALTALIDQLASFDQGQLNLEPFKGSWTAGQVGEHMIMANSGFVEMINGSVTDTERAPDQFVAQIRDDFSNYQIKMQSPDFILPDAEAKDPAEFVEGFTRNREAVDKVIATVDLNKTVASVEFPQMGTLTGWEWICFMTCHAIRHTRQLQNIYAALHPAS